MQRASTPGTEDSMSKHMIVLTATRLALSLTACDWITWPTSHW
jgi:hypothetical protein